MKEKERRVYTLFTSGIHRISGKRRDPAQRTRTPNKRGRGRPKRGKRERNRQATVERIPRSWSGSKSGEAWNRGRNQNLQFPAKIKSDEYSGDGGPRDEPSNILTEDEESG